MNLLLNHDYETIVTKDNVVKLFSYYYNETIEKAL